MADPSIDPVAAHRLLNDVAAAQGAHRALRAGGLHPGDRDRLERLLAERLAVLADALGDLVRGYPPLA